MYRSLWKRLTAGEARVRAVGTLTRNYEEAVPDELKEKYARTKTPYAERLVARDVLWRELRDALDATPVEPDVELVKQSFISAIDERISPKDLTECELEEFFANHSPLHDGVAEQIEGLIRGAGPRKRRTPRDPDMRYRCWHVPLPAAQPSPTPLRLRLFICPAGTLENVYRAPHALIAGLERGTQGKLPASEAEAAETAGFAWSKTIYGAWIHQCVWPVQEAESVGAEGVAQEIVNMLAKTRLLACGAVGGTHPDG